MCVISPISRHVASLCLLPESSWLSLSALVDEPSLKDIGLKVDPDGDSEIKTFVDQLLGEEGPSSLNSYFPSLVPNDDNFAKGDILKSNFVEKKRRFSSYHWDLLKNW